MTLNIAIDEQLARRAEEVAESRGMSLDQLIRRYLQDLTQSPAPPAQGSAEEDIAELRRLSTREMRGILRGIDTTVERDLDRV